MRTQISYFWKEANARRGYRAGVSIHSHTNHSRESLSFLWDLGERIKPLRWYLEQHQQRATKRGIPLDFSRGYWTPPVTAREAYDLERNQIENKLELDAIVSLSDHDNIEAATLLHVVPEFRRIPISIEWTIPFFDCCFHLGVHNLPPSRAASIVEELNRYTANPNTSWLRNIFGELNKMEGVLIVFNHPVWNLYNVPRPRFDDMLNEFLVRYSAFIHAFELNGLRTWKENREVAELALGWNQLVISGGDRHGREPNGNVNLTNATSFEEFVYEIRVRRMSHVMFMPQYADTLAFRFFQTFLDTIREYPEYPEGARRWDDRVFHPDPAGVIRPLSALWAHPPKVLDDIFWLSRQFESSNVRHMLQSATRKNVKANLIGGEPTYEP